MSIDLLWRWKTFVSQLSCKRIEHAARAATSGTFACAKAQADLGCRRSGSPTHALWLTYSGPRRPGPRGHYQQSLSFFQAATLQQLDDGQHFSDSVHQFEPSYHFDGSQFQETATNINALYSQVLTELAADFTDGDFDRGSLGIDSHADDAAEYFGMVVHAAQTFMRIRIGLSRSNRG